MFLGFGEPMIPLIVAIIGIVVLSTSMFLVGYNTGKSDAKHEQAKS